jgi:hypothetical protein
MRNSRLPKKGEGRAAWGGRRQNASPRLEEARRHGIGASHDNIA